MESWASPVLALEGAQGPNQHRGKAARALLIREVYSRILAKQASASATKGKAKNHSDRGIQGSFFMLLKSPCIGQKDLSVTVSDPGRPVQGVSQEEKRDVMNKFHPSDTRNIIKFVGRNINRSKSS